MKTLYLESIAGIAGDMFSASFLDAGLVSPLALQELPQRLHLPEVKLFIQKVNRAHISATHIDVQYDERISKQYFAKLSHHHSAHSEEHHHVHYSVLDNLILSADIADEVKNIARDILSLLAMAEAHCHGVKKEEVMFHEIGSIDSIMDIVMAAHCIASINPQSVIASPIKLGRGVVKTAHGALAVPPPVSAALAMNMTVDSLPLAISQENIELSTPTGLATLKFLQPNFSKEWPAGKILAQGCGAGTMNLEAYPNLFRVCLLETNNAIMNKSMLPYLNDVIMEINANYDDASPEYLSWAVEKLFAYGAVDVWQTAAVGKKGRMMIVLSVLVPLMHWQQCINFLLKKTSTFGVRYKQLDRFILARQFEKKITDKGEFQVKVGLDRNGNILKEKAEFEDIKHVWDNDLAHE
jgi:pyridinium-3,5-bisthiocarboxylic acid mononucleotide nickel chelatase